MTDLELIKKNVAFLYERDSDATVAKEFNEIVEAASHLAAELARLTAELKDTEYNADRLVIELNHYRVACTKLTAELAKRPDVVHCGECLKRNNRQLVENDCPFIYEIYDNDTGLSKIGFAITNDNGFCSYGKRKADGGEGK